MNPALLYPDADHALREFAGKAVGSPGLKAPAARPIDVIDAVIGAARHLDPIARRDKRLVAQILTALADRYGVDVPKGAP